MKLKCGIRINQVINKIVKISLISILLTIIIFAPVFPQAIVFGQPQPGDPIGAIPLGDYLKLSDDTKISDVYSTPAFIVNLIVRNLFVVAGVLLLVIGLYSGSQYIFGGKSGVENAKKTLTAAAVGFILMFSAYWIIQVIKIITATDIIL